MKSYLAVAVGVCISAGTICSAAAEEAQRVGYSAGFLTDPFQAVLVKKALAEAKGAGLETMPATNANGDAGKQISDMQNLIASGANGILVNPTDSRAIIPALKAAESSEIPVVAIDMAPAGGKVAMIVRADNVMMGRMACEQLGAAIGGKGKVLSLLGDQATTNGRERTKGFSDCMAQKFPSVEIIEQPTNWRADKTATATQTVLGSTPDLAAIYLQSDSVMLNSVLNALKAVGKLKPRGQDGHVVAVSIDGTPYALQQMRAGYLDAIVAQPLNGYATHGVEYLKRAIAKETFSPGPTNHNSTIVMQDGNPVDFLSAPLVTPDNVDDKALWGNAAQ
jgi:ABC-type sugar transport system substrate-binding protein